METTDRSCEGCSKSLQGSRIKARFTAENWAVLTHDNIVPVFGTTGGFGPSIALVLPWFQSGTLLRLIAEQGASLNIRSRLNLFTGWIWFMETLQVFVHLLDMKLF
ncbi:hypothetical protein BDR03DRAFT_216031 [Suillus americanus]|nr:hypothetical protein BDR03DRAFT_216031 [Suillus americanus]